MAVNGYGLKTTLDEQYIKKVKQDFGKLINDLKQQAKDNPIEIKIRTVNEEIIKTHTNIKNVNNVINETNRSTQTLAQNFGNVVSKCSQWALGMGAVFSIVEKIRNGISYINKVDMAQTNISMISELPKKQVQELTKAYSDLAGQYHSTTEEVLDGAERYLRAGKTIEQSQSLIKDTIVTQKLSKQSQGEIADEMIAAMNAFGFTAEQMKREYVDKISELDARSATSAKDISEAVMHSAKSAQLAKVSWDFLLASETAVMDVTKKSGSEVGNSFRTIYSRMQGLAKGKKDDDGTDINQVEKVLGKQDIALRKNRKEWRSMEDVLKDVMEKWDKIQSVDKADIVSKLGGTYNRETIMTLLENQNRVKELLKATEESAGSADKKMAIYSESTDARLQDLKHSWENLYSTMFNSNTINETITGLESIVKTLEMLATTEKSSGIALAGLSASFILLVKNANAVRTAFVRMGAIMELFTIIQRGVGTTAALSTAFNALASSIKASTLAFVTNPITLTIAALSALTYGVVSHIKHQKELKDQTDSLKTSYQGLTEAMKENNQEGMKSNSEKIQTAQNELQANITAQKEAKKELDKAMEELKKNPSNIVNQTNAQSAQANYDSLTKKIKEQEGVLEKARITFNKTTGEVEKLGEAQKQIANNVKIDEAKNKIAFYNQVLDEMSEKGKISAETTQDIITKHQELIPFLNDEAQMHEVLGQKIEEQQAIEQQVMLNELKDNADFYSNMLKNNADYFENIQKNYGINANSYKTYTQLIEAINKTMLSDMLKDWDKYYNTLDEALQSQEDKLVREEMSAGMKMNGDSAHDAKYVEEANAIDKKLQSFEKGKAAIKSLEEEFAKGTSSFNSSVGSSTKALDEGFTPSLDKNKKSQKENTDMVKTAKNELKSYENALKDCDIAIKQLDYDMNKMYQGSEKYIGSLDKKKQLLEEELNLTKQAIEVNEQNANSLRDVAGAYNTVNTPIGGGRQWTGKYSTWINDAAAKNGLDPILIAAIIQQESSFNPNDVNPKSGATGLGQFLASTASEEGITDRKDPQQSIYGLAKYLKKRIGWAGGNLWAGVRGYGEGTQEYENLIRGWYNKFSNGQMSDDAGSAGNTTLEGGAEDIVSRIESLKSKAIELEESIDKIAIDKFNAKLLQFDDQLAHVDRNKEKAQTEYELNKNNTSKDGLEQSSKNAEGIWKEINWHYSVLTEKEKYITSQLYNNDFDEKTKSEMLKTLEQVRIERKKTVVELHKEFQSWLQETYANKIKENKDNIDELQQKIDELDAKDKNNYNGKIELNKQILNQQEQIKTKTLEQITFVEDLLAKEKDSNTKQIWIEQIKQLNKDLSETNKNISSIQNNIAEATKSAMDIINTVENKIAEMIKKDVEKKKEAYDKDLDNFRTAIEEKKKLLNDQYNSEDYQRKLADENKKKQDIQDKINVLSLDDSLEAQAQVVELKKQLAEQQKSIDDMVRQHNRDEETKSLDKQLSDQEKLVKEKKDSLDKQYTDEQINIMARQALIDGYYKDVNGNIQDIQTAYIAFENRFGEGMTSMGSMIENEFIAKLKEAKELISQVPKLNDIVNNSTNANYNNSSDSNSTGFKGVVYGSGADIQNAGILKSYGYLLQDISDGKQYTASENDLIVGGSLVTENIQNNGAKRLWGENKELTQAEIIRYAHSLNEKVGSHRNGAIITQTELSVLHGTESNWEAVLNQPQLKGLVSDSVLSTLQNIKLPSSLLPNLNIPQLPTVQSTGLKNGDVNLHFDNLINVQGNVDKTVIPNMQQIASNVMSELKNSLNRRGNGR